jgi:glycerate 2-kinase
MMPRALLAPDKFKGTFAAAEVAELLAAGFAAEGWSADLLPLGDGGEGTADALLAARGGRWIEADAHDPLDRAVRARFALLSDGTTAVVEVAAASGLWRVAENERDAVKAGTRGTGELIAAAIAHGATTVVVAAGGSATTDGGRGAIEALGAAADGVRLVVACDVQTPWDHAAEVFGPQKGAAAQDVAELRIRLDRLAGIAPRDPRGVPMSGCAGGLSGGLWAWLGAELVPGAELVLDAVGFDAHARTADVVVTGEGALDAQTLAGKAVAVVAARSGAAGAPCVAVVGRNRATGDEQRVLGLRSVVEAGTAEQLRAAATSIVAFAGRRDVASNLDISSCKRLHPLSGYGIFPAVTTTRDPRSQR